MTELGELLAKKLPNATIAIRQHGVEIYRRESDMKIERFCGPIQQKTAQPFDWAYWTKRT
ncbi:hypothetical protein [Methylocucumis oryzae]|uniref:Uncharacterized protein n=1 Tax=Methylocucumis oryzae TaxID=1632867 RepID=A0A0F3IMT9_9GAMM|nr:hypothetical protein [Methylocucumis oryzae]KJV08007.1 hypothetical protein VZ94_00895 [Methylocucumis oryzae]